MLKCELTKMLSFWKHAGKKKNAFQRYRRSAAEHAQVNRQAPFIHLELLNTAFSI